MTRPVLAPVTVTERYPNPETGRLEAWAARTDDGKWTLTRLEQSRRPWAARCSEGEVWYGSQRAAREAIADGSALALIEARRKEAA